MFALSLTLGPVALARTPTVPYLEIRGLDGASVAARIAYRGAGNALAQARACSGERAEVLGFCYGELDVACKVGSDEVGKFERCQGRGGKPRGYRVSPPRYHRDAHPQRVQRRHSAAVGKWVKH